MKPVLICQKQNILRRSAAAPDQGAVALFCSTWFDKITQKSTIYQPGALALTSCSASKKASPHKDRTVPAYAKIADM